MLTRVRSSGPGPGVREVQSSSRVHRDPTRYRLHSSVYPGISPVPGSFPVPPPPGWTQVRGGSGESEIGFSPLPESGEKIRAGAVAKAGAA